LNRTEKKKKLEVMRNKYTKLFNNCAEDNLMAVDCMVDSEMVVVDNCQVVHLGCNLMMVVEDSY
jgi:hypothetical protein